MATAHPGLCGGRLEGSTTALTWPSTQTTPLVSCGHVWIHCRPLPSAAVTGGSVFRLLQTSLTWQRTPSSLSPAEPAETSVSHALPPHLHSFKTSCCKWLTKRFWFKSQQLGPFCEEFADRPGACVGFSPGTVVLKTWSTGSSLILNCFLDVNVSVAICVALWWM